MLVELHSLTAHAPANLNRDDLGRPKTAMYGGVERARISSQALKRSIRTSNYLEENLGDRLSTRSRQIPKLIHDALAAEMESDEKKDRLKEVCEAFVGTLGKADNKRPLHTAQIVFLTPGEIERSTEHIRSIVNGDEKLTKTFLKNFASEAAHEIGLDRNAGDGVDMALFGRMTTDEEGTFAGVDASMQVAHAISTHAVKTETDWFTAVDDVTSGKENDRGSGHIGELDFNSAVYYKYLSCNLPLLIRNMNGATEEAIDALAAVLDAACRVTPSGKQNTFASHALADTILLVHRPERIPVSLAGVFERAVQADNGSGYLAPSRAAMVRHYADLLEAYGMNDHAALFCVDADAREDLRKKLPESVSVFGSMKETFDWLKKHLKEEVPASGAGAAA